MFVSLEINISSYGAIIKRRKHQPTQVCVDFSVCEGLYYESVQCDNGRMCS